MARLPHRRIPYDGQTTAWFATSSLGSLRGHRPTRHSPSDPASPRRACQGVRSAMPPRYLAFEEVKVCLQIPKLDLSAPHFIRSRTLVDSECLELTCVAGTGPGIGAEPPCCLLLR